MNKYILLFLVIILINYTNVVSQTLISDTTKFQQMLDSSVHDSYTNLNSYKRLPKYIRQSLDRINNYKFRIANQSERYNSSDALINSHLPNRRLIYAVKSNNFYIITYTLGSYSSNVRSIIIRYKEEKILWTISFVPPDHADVYQLFEAIKYHKNLFLLSKDI